MKTSKITDVMFEAKWKDFDIYKLQVANGQSGSILTKTWKPQVGEEFSYTYDVEKSRFKRVTESSYSPQGASKSYSGGSGSKDKLIVRQVALKAAVEFSAGRNLKADQVLQVAEIFNDWVNTSEQPAEAPTPPPSAVREQAPLPVAKDDDDLPF